MFLKSIAYTEREGGKWIYFNPRIKIDIEELPFLVGKGIENEMIVDIPQDNYEEFFVHSLRFEFGHEWDCINGWRLQHTEETWQELIDEQEILISLQEEEIAKNFKEIDGITEYLSWFF